MARTTAIAMELRSKEIARRLLWGQPHTEIISELGLTYQQFHHIVDSPRFRDELRQLQQLTYQELDDRFRGEMETVQSRARGEALTAVDQLIALMKTSASESLKRDCANDIIKYSGQSDAAKSPVIQINHATFELIQRTQSEDESRRVLAIAPIPTQAPAEVRAEAPREIGFTASQPEPKAEA